MSNSYKLLKAVISRMNDTTFECPYCSYVEDGADSESSDNLVTYWGDGDPIKLNCGGCGVEIAVKETVSRSFEAAKSMYDFD